MLVGLNFGRQELELNEGACLVVAEVTTPDPKYERTGNATIECILFCDCWSLVSNYTRSTPQERGNSESLHDTKISNTDFNCHREYIEHMQAKGRKSHVTYLTWSPKAPTQRVHSLKWKMQCTL